jgi:hypothetical protein
VFLGEEEVMRDDATFGSWNIEALYIWKQYMVVLAQAHEWPHSMLAVNGPGSVDLSDRILEFNDPAHHMQVARTYRVGQHVRKAAAFLRSYADISEAPVACHDGGLKTDMSESR